MKYANGIEFTQQSLDSAYIDFVRQSTDILLVTFDPMPKAAVNRINNLRIGWGGEFVLEQGYSCLFVKPTKKNWYRDLSLFEHFDFLKRTDFFGQFKKVVFAGSSMGGYGALAFSSLVPGSTVIALNPQVSLSFDLAPWETRYAGGRAQNWTGQYCDASLEIVHAKCVFVVYDPFFKLDALHISLLHSPNVEFLKLPFVGHKTALWLQRTGMLKEFMKSAIEGNLTQERFKIIADKRKNNKHYYQTIYNVLLAKGKIKSAALVSAKAAAAGFSIKSSHNHTETKSTGAQKSDYLSKKLRKKGKRANTERKRATRQLVDLDLADIIADIKSQNPRLCSDTNENETTRFVHMALAEIAKTVGEIQEGIIKMPGFGNFRVRQLKRKKAGEKITVRRVLFSTHLTKK